MAKNVLTDNLSEPLNGVTMAEIDIDVGDGNLTLDQLAGGEPLLVSGVLQYVEKQGQPARSLLTRNERATFTLRGGAAPQRWFRLPWAACNGATEWRVHVNPGVTSDITAHTDGGNVKLDLTGMAVTRIFAETGGGNVDVVLPEHAAQLSVTAKTGAGAVAVHIPVGVAARIHATTGMGEVVVDPRFSKIGDNAYASPDWNSAANRSELTLSSGAGSVSVQSR
jgi:hypothetical protein